MSLRNQIFFQEYQPNKGVDMNAQPNRWIMIPKGGYQSIAFISYVADVTDFDFFSFPQGHVKIGNYRLKNVKSQDHSVVLDLPIWALRGGDGYIEARHKTNPKWRARLDFSVKDERQVSVFYFFVQSKSPQTASRRWKTEIPSIVATANKVLQPQANVRLVGNHHKDLVINEDLGSVVRFKEGGKASWDELQKIKKEAKRQIWYRGIKAEVIVLFVRELEEGRRPNGYDVDGCQSGRFITIEDSLNPVKNRPGVRNCDAVSGGVVLAHELGHYLMNTGKDHKLRISGKNRTTSQLMHKWGWGWNIPKDDANRMNPTHTVTQLKSH